MWPLNAKFSNAFKLSSHLLVSQWSRNPICFLKFVSPFFSKGPMLPPLLHEEVSRTVTGILIASQSRCPNAFLLRSRWKHFRIIFIFHIFTFFSSFFCSSTSSPNEILFSFSPYRLALYKTLYSSLLSSARSTITSSSVLTLAIRIFRFGRSSDRDLDVTHFCQESLTACQMWAHPSPPSVPPSVAEPTPSLSLQSASSSCYSQPLSAPLPSSLSMFSSSDSFSMSATPIAKAASLPRPEAMSTPSQVFPPPALSPPHVPTQASSSTLTPSSPSTKMTDSLEITSHISELSVRSPSLPPKVCSFFLFPSSPPLL